MELNPARVPPGVVPLIPMAERWGIEDDGYREEAIDEASEVELQALVDCLDLIHEDELFDWLAGSESQYEYPELPSQEYFVFTCLTMAIESAKVELSRRRAQDEEQP